MDDVNRLGLIGQKSQRIMCIYVYNTFHKLRKLKYSLHMNAKIETIKQKEGITATNDIQ